MTVLMSGLVDLPWWGYVVVAMIMTHITIAAVTIFLHRHQAHRALDLHPVVSHFFRFWLWLTTGMVTREWAAIHRKHHAKCESEDDPHSPQVFGIRKVFWEGAELYRAESLKKETLVRYGHGVPDDWIERHLYNKYSTLGIVIMFAIDVALFGFLGITIWAVQMAWIPVFAAGVINGVGHYWGYRSFQPEDASRNILPWGILIGGEELHNNHHAYATSARFSNRWYEVDVGWVYIRLMEMVGLAQVKKVAPKLQIKAEKSAVDAVTLQAVVTHRYEVLTKYAKSVLQTCVAELRHLRAQAPGLDRATLKRWLHTEAAALPEDERQRRQAVVSASATLSVVYTMRDELASIWKRSTGSKEQLVCQLEDWCRRAEESGIEALQQFSWRLRCYA